MVDGERGPDETRWMDPPEEIGRGAHGMGHESGPAASAWRRRIIFQRVANVVWTVIGFIEALIGLRVVLKLIGANPANGFVRTVYDLSGVFVNPFLGIVRDPRSGDMVLEINALIAMLVYLLIGWGIVRIVWLIFETTAPTEV
ncbi:MAG: hypothetical protein QJR03_04020 [Sphaerobacter sp.]|nr:hypothetical protein [Sphaerobacter sp.]